MSKLLCVAGATTRGLELALSCIGADATGRMWFFADAADHRPFDGEMLWLLRITTGAARSIHDLAHRTGAPAVAGAHLGVANQAAYSGVDKIIDGHRRAHPSPEPISPMSLLLFLEQREDKYCVNMTMSTVI